MTSNAPALTTDTFKVLLRKLILTPDGFTVDDVRAAFSYIVEPSYVSDTAAPVQIASFLTSLKLHGLDFKADTLATAADVLLQKSHKVDLPKDEDGEVGALDIVGTGGDGHDTYNVSTTAAIVVAGAGCRICKHGSKAASSTSGSADLLLSLSIPLLTLPPTALPAVLPTSPFVFLFAPLYQTALAPMAPIRRTLGFPTIFNIIGPLINPARPKRAIMGVHSAQLGPVFADSLKMANVEKAWVVCGREGLDEISPAGETDVWQVERGVITHFVISPSSFNLPSCPLSNVKSYEPTQNAAILLRLLSSPRPSPSDALNLPPVPAEANIEALKNYTLMNAAALLLVADKAKTLPDGVEMARKSMDEGGARKALDKFRAACVTVKGEPGATA